MRWDMKKRSVPIYCMLGLFVVLAVLTLLTSGTIQWILMILTLVALVGYVAVWSILWRCPHCGMLLGRMERAAYCKHCGKRLYRGNP